MTPVKTTLTQTIQNRDDLWVAISNGATLITPNNRLSNQLLQDYFKQSCRSVKEKPLCLPYPAFLRDQYKKARHLYSHSDHLILLNTQQQRYLWQQILSECNKGLLEEIQDAFMRCQHWQLDINDSAFAQTPQTRQFQTWCQQFQHRLDAIGALTEATLANHLLNYPDLLNATTIIWACFDDFTPQQQALQAAINAAGSVQYAYDLTDKPSTTHQYVANDSQDESLQILQWLKLKLQANETRIAVVVPALQGVSHRLQRLFQRHIPPHLFDISLGQSLMDYPLIAHALCWLNLDKKTVSHSQARLLLNSPYLKGSKTESFARAEGLQSIKVLQESIISFPAFVQAIHHTAPALAELLEKLDDYPKEATVGTWINLFKARLLYLGFPGDYPLISLAYQCFQRLMMLFDELLPLSLINPLMQKTEVLNALSDLAAATIFQAQKSTAPIQILGLLEASGCTFDSVWVSGLTDQCLPQKTQLSAFIPIDLQRDKLMPHATPERELQFAVQLLQRLKNGSQDTVFSYPSLTGDTPNLPSPLITHFPKLAALAPIQAPSNTHLIAYDEPYLLPFTTTEIISGGTALLANQAKCPFRAFATHRLSARPGLPQTDGPNLSERGQIMHQIMDNLWQGLGSQQHLLSLSQEALQQQIEAAITTALTPLCNENRPSFSRLIQAVESSRLHQLVNASLDWEKQRSPFIVEALEQEFTIPLAGIHFRVRVDRLDRVSTDKKWVIDYKSSLPINKPWNEERPEEPQLLLYALLDDHINALLFLQLKAGRITCSGLSEDFVALQGMGTLKKGEHWPNRQQEWRQQLTELAREFRTGRSPPTPHRQSTCQRCDFPNLCRIEQP